MARQQHSYNSGRIHRAGTGGAAVVPAKRKKKGKGLKVFVTVVLVLALLATSAYAIYYWFVSGMLDPGGFGKIDRTKYGTEKQYKNDVINVLLVGVDYEEGRSHALTDLILYINYDIKSNQVNMLQIPRDTWVGKDYSVDGKINSAMSTGQDKSAPINNLVKVITEQYKLPVDTFVTLDMDSMRDIVDLLGGLLVYVPLTMDYKGSHLDEGWQWLDGAAAEYFVRNRYGVGFERADIDRLDNQRYFYSALFKRLMTLSLSDIGIVEHILTEYCNTDLDVSDVTKLAIPALKLNSNNILFCKAPGATGVPYYDGHYVIDLYGHETAEGEEEAPGLANLLNEYFRTYGDQVPASQLGTENTRIQIATNISLYPPNIQTMGGVEETEPGSETVNVIPGT